jgi:uncharacterized protein YchJ
VQPRAADPDDADDRDAQPPCGSGMKYKRCHGA